MADFLLTREASIYAGAYFGAVFLMAVWEAVAPRRSSTAPLGKRWRTNFGLALIDSALMRWVAPITGITAAVIVSEHGWGLFNGIAVPYWLAFTCSVFLLDLAGFGQHVLLHNIPPLWRIHRTHHADLDGDFSTGVRFHPLEAAYTITITLAVIVVFGIPVLAVFVYETLVAVSTFAVHGNVRYPLGIDRVLRLVMVTPETHRVHHSILLRESNRNFGIVLSCWDYFFGTYLDQPAGGHESMTLGVAERRDPKYLSLRWVLADPFLPDAPEPTVSE